MNRAPREVDERAAVARVVAIDGASGSGKSTVARAVADALGLPVLDTGAMYRAVTLAVLETAVAPTHEAACLGVAQTVVIELENGRTLLDGRDVSAEIRGPEVTAAVSTVSAHRAVRHLLVEQQRDWVLHHGGGVVEGRDIGTVVFPAAPVKVFLVADVEERARRRQRDEHAADRDVAVDEVQAALDRRDAYDSSRVVSPLRAADDALVIDTTARSVPDITAEIAERFRTGE
jgi:CMP/dCMP kinase